LNPEILYKEESYKIIGICMEIYRILGKGFLEIVYKDALEYELKKLNILFKREKEFPINYKDTVLPHKFYADFVVFEKIIIEVKSSKSIIDENTKQILNYLTVTKFKLGLIINFGESSLKYKRLVL